MRDFTKLKRFFVVCHCRETRVEIRSCDAVESVGKVTPRVKSVSRNARLYECACYVVCIPYKKPVRVRYTVDIGAPTP